MKKTMLHTAISGALLSACLGFNVQAQDFNQLYVFGDSLSDGGTYSQAVMAGGAPATTIGGDSMRYRFIDNSLDGSSQTYAEGLADLLDLPLDPATINGVPAASIPAIDVGGGNYAQGGSRVTDPTGIGHSPVTGITTLSVDAQVSNFLASGASLGSDDLIIIWAGANDVFAQTAAVGGGTPTATALSNIATAADDVRTQVDRLKSAGANNIMVVTLPDIGDNTPAGVTTGGATQALYTALSDTFNAQLLTALSGSNAAIVDADKLLTAILDDPANYGFSAVNQRTTFECLGSSLSCIQGVNTLNDGVSRVFADGVHPTSQAHQLFAQAAFAGLQAISQNAALSIGTLSALKQQSLGLDNRLNSAAFYMRNEKGNRVERTVGNTEVYGGVEGGSYEVSGGQIRPKGEGSTKVLKIAGDMMVSERIVLGAGVSVDYGDVNFTDNRGGFESRLVTAAVFGAVQITEGVYANFSAGYGDIDVSEVTRSFALGAATERYTGSTNGEYKTISAGLGAMLPAGNGLTFNPTIKLTSERVSIDGYTESNGAASLSYGDQEYKGLRLSTGVAGYYRPVSSPKMVLSLRGTLEHDFNDDEIAVTLGPDANNLATLSSERDDRTYGYLSFRAAYELTPASALVLSASKVVGLENNSGHTLGLTFKHQL
ncbi:MAG: autotransporter domain-containing protein [Sedimenticola sp.]